MHDKSQEQSTEIASALYLAPLGLLLYRYFSSMPIRVSNPVEPSSSTVPAWISAGSAARHKTDDPRDKRVETLRDTRQIPTKVVPG